MIRLKLILMSVIFFVASNACADEDSSNFNYCDVSKVAINDYEPVTFETINNLLRKTGEESMFCGESIVVYGRVLDQNCVPVSDAKIYAWQTDCEGKYPYKALKENVVDKELMSEEQTNLTFVGNGTATTNNKGEFHFVTVYPPSMHDYGPHLNVRVEHFAMGSLQTRLILKGKKAKNPRNDPDLSSISGAAAKKGMSIYKFEIVIPGTTNRDY